MKKILLVLVALILAFSLIACDDTTDESTKESNETSTTQSTNGDGGNNNPDDNVPGDGEDQGGNVPGGDDDQGGNVPGGDTGNSGSQGGNVPGGDTGNSGSQGGNVPGGDQSGNVPGGDQSGNVPGGDQGGDNPSGDPEKPSDTTGLILTQALIKQFEEAASMKLEFIADVVLNENYWNDGVEDTRYMHGIAKLYLTVAKTENGYNLKIDADVTSDDGEGMKPDVKGTLLYVVDGVIYTYDEDLDVYLTTELPSVDTAEIEAMIAQLLEEVNLSQDDVNAILNELGNSMIYIFNIVENKGSISADFKPVFDALVSYLNGIDMEKDTLKDIINDVLALVSEDLTVDALIQQMVAMGNTKFGEFINALDATLKQESGMGIQDLYDEVIGNEMIQAALAQMYIEQGVPEEEVQEMIASMVEADIMSMIPEEMLDASVYMVIMSMFAESEAELPETAEEFAAVINALLGMTLAEAEAAFEAPIFTQLKMFAAAFDLKALDFDIDINFTGVFKLESVVGEANFSMVQTLPDYDDPSKNEVLSVAINITFKLYEISKESIEIAAPTDKECYVNIFDNSFEIYDENGEYVGKVDVYVDYENNIAINMNYFGYEAYGSTSLENFEGNALIVENSVFSTDGESVEVGTIIIVFDTLNNVATVVVPEAE